MTVLASELRRLAKRPTFLVLRAILSLLVFALFALSYELSGIQAGYVARYGEALFQTTIPVLQFAAVLLTPALVARGLEEEREESTLALLILTGLRPLTVVLGKVGVRLIQMVMLLLAPAPALALAVSLGGVALLQPLTVAWSLTQTLLALGLAGAWLGLRVGGGLAATLGGLGIAASTLVVPALSAFWTEEIGIGLQISEHFAAASLLSAPYGGATHALAAPLSLAPLSLIALAAIRRTLRGDPLRASGWVPVALFVPFSLALPLLFPLLTHLNLSLTPSQWGWLWVGATAPAVSGMSLLWVGAVLAAGSLDSPGRAWSLRAFSLAFPSKAGLKWGALRDARTPRVWDAPVLWRELRTRAHAPLLRLGFWLALPWSALWIGGGVWVHLADDTDLVVMWIVFQNLAAIAGIFHGVLGTTVVGLRSVAGERRDGTLELLLLTPLSPTSLILSKAGATAVFGLVPLLLGVAVGQSALTSIGYLIHQQGGTLHALGGFLWLGGATATGLFFAVGAWALLTALSFAAGILLEHSTAWVFSYATAVMVIFPLLGCLFEVNGVLTLMGWAVTNDPNAEPELLLIALAGPTTEFILGGGGLMLAALLGVLVRDVLSDPARGLR